MLFIVGIIAAAIVVLSALYGVVALMIEYRHWENEFEEEDNDDNERGVRKGGGVLYRIYC